MTCPSQLKNSVIAFDWRLPADFYYKGDIQLTQANGRNMRGFFRWDRGHCRKFECFSKTNEVFKMLTSSSG